jgi:predicted lipoprotein with Yx(FWY)xxD motif
MKTFYKSLSAIAACLLYAGAALSQAAPALKADGVLVSNAGMTLYTFDQDVQNSGKCACNGPCAAIWPSVPSAAGSQVSLPYSVVTRDDGAKQLAYNGKPLYRYAADTKPGERAGDNFNNVWHVVKD